jgi:hypothetical protein
VVENQAAVTDGNIVVTLTDRFTGFLLSDNKPDKSSIQKTTNLPDHQKLMQHVQTGVNC